MTPRTADVVVGGAGIAGIATAYLLATRTGASVVVCDPRPPLTLTSDKSTECYRNFWPNGAMVTLMNRSIDLMEEVSAESGDTIGLNRRGYLYATGDAGRLAAIEKAATLASQHGSGPVRVHAGTADDPHYTPSPVHEWQGAPDGFDLVTDPRLLADLFPGITEAALGGLHVRRAGWVSAQQMGAHMLDRALAAGATLVRQEVAAVEVTGGRVTGVRLADGAAIACGAFVNAAGPLVGDVAQVVGVDLPVHSEVHLKVSVRDTLGVVPREAPLMIWADPQDLAWSDSERRHLEAEGRTDVLATLPEGCHGRPEGGADSPWALALWEYEKVVRQPTWPIPQDPLYAEVVLRGMAAILPAMGGYAERMPETVVDGGYYTKTVDNRPLVGPVGPEGSFVVGALSGYGVMAACGVADLAAAHITGAPLPSYGSDFTVERFEDPEYLTEIVTSEDSGQI